jgi:hypothetical protein
MHLSRRFALAIAIISSLPSLSSQSSRLEKASELLYFEEVGSKALERSENDILFLSFPWKFEHPTHVTMS